MNDVHAVIAGNDIRREANNIYHYLDNEAISVEKCVISQGFFGGEIRMMHS